MTTSLSELSRGAIADLGKVFSAVPEDAADPLIEAILSAKRIWPCAALPCACFTWAAMPMLWAT